MPLTDGMVDILVRIMVKLLSILALATKQIKQGRFSKLIFLRYFPFVSNPPEKFAKVLFKGGGDIEAVLQRLDRLCTQQPLGMFCLRVSVQSPADCVMKVSMQGTASLVNNTRRL